MGRELRRKQAKKDGVALKEEQIKKEEGPYSDIYKLLKTFGVLLVIVLAVHFFTALVITKEIEWFSKEDVKETIKVQDSILAKNSFMQTEEEYYVYYYDTEEENAEIQNKLYSVKEKIYRVDLHDAMNSNFVAEASGIVDSIENLKVSDPTLIKVSSEKIVEFYTGKDEIVSALN